MVVGLIVLDCENLDVVKLGDEVCVSGELIKCGFILDVFDCFVVVELVLDVGECLVCCMIFDFFVSFLVMLF